MSRNSFLAVALFLHCTSWVQAQSKPSGFTEKGLKNVRQVVQIAIDKKTLPGAVVFISRNGQTVLLEAFGQADTNREMKTDAIFRMASMSKPITSVAVMMLVEDGKIRLEDSLAKYVPEFEDVRILDPNSGELIKTNRAITIRDLLTHTSGITYRFFNPKGLKKYHDDIGLADGLNTKNPTLKENTERVAKIPLAHQPGTTWTYGMNADVLGGVIEIASGQSLDKFLYERIFKPLKMTDTGFSVPKENHSRLMAVYKATQDRKVSKIQNDPETHGVIVYSAKRVLEDAKYLSGGAGIVSSTSDYARFLQMLLNEGELDGVRVLKAETVRTVTSNQIDQLNTFFPLHGNKFGFGFGVNTQENGVTSVGSFSWSGLYYTFFWVDPKKKLVGLIMTQLYPWGGATLWQDFQKAVYAALEDNPTPPKKTNPDDQRRQTLYSRGNVAKGKQLFTSNRHQRRFIRPGSRCLNH
jgi:CubicO group peptidase (beta-lactamase class C family)